MVSAESPLQNADIGTVPLAGGASFQDENLVVEGSGAGVEQAGDSFHYVWQANQGDYVISAKILPGENAEGAIVIRETENPASAGIWIGFNFAGKINVASRSSKNGTIARTELDAGGTEPIWLRAVKTGNALVLSYSEDGLVWDEFHQVTVTLPERTLAGFGVSGAEADAFFEGFSILANVQAIEEESAATPNASEVPNPEAVLNSPQATDSPAADDGAQATAISPTAAEKHPENKKRTPRRKLYVNKLLGDDACDGLVSLKSGKKGPKKTFQAALSLAKDGDEIVISSGTYSLSELNPPGNISITPVGEVVWGSEIITKE